MLKIEIRQVFILMIHLTGAGYLKLLVDALQRQVNSLTEQVATMSQSYEELIEGRGSMDGLRLTFSIVLSAEPCLKNFESGIEMD